MLIIFRKSKHHIVKRRDAKKVNRKIQKKAHRKLSWGETLRLGDYLKRRRSTSMGGRIASQPLRRSTSRDLFFHGRNGNDKTAVLRVQLADGDFLNGGAES